MGYHLESPGPDVSPFKVPVAVAAKSPAPSAERAGTWADVGAGRARCSTWYLLIFAAGGPGPGTALIAPSASSLFIFSSSSCLPFFFPRTPSRVACLSSKGPCHGHARTTKARSPPTPRLGHRPPLEMGHRAFLRPPRRLDLSRHSTEATGVVHHASEVGCQPPTRITAVEFPPRSPEGNRMALAVLRVR